MPTLTADQSVVTYQDAIDRLVDYISQNAQAGGIRVIKQTVLDVYDDIVNGRDWPGLSKPYRLATEAPESGTLSYVSSTGLFTIDSGSWPTWAELAILQVGDVWSLIKTRTSGTVLVADDIMRPIADIATGTAFTIYKAVFPLPADFRRMRNPMDEAVDTYIEQVDFAEWMRLAHSELNGEPEVYAVAAHPYNPASFVLLAYPFADSDRTVDFAYQRFGRRLKYNGHDSPCRDGTITAATTTAVTGASTAFESDMVGAILRYGRTTTVYPDGIGGSNAFKQQVYISAYTSATSITLHEAITISAGKYTISDPIDLDRTMMDAFWRGCEHKLSQRLKLPGLAQAEKDYEIALEKARGASSKSTGPRSAWGPRARGLVSRVQIITGGGDDD